MIFAFFTTLAAAMTSLILFQAARPKQKRVAIRIQDEDQRPRHPRFPN